MSASGRLSLCLSILRHLYQQRTLGEKEWKSALISISDSIPPSLHAQTSHVFGIWVQDQKKECAVKLPTENRIVESCLVSLPFFCVNCRSLTCHKQRPASQIWASEMRKRSCRLWIMQFQILQTPTKLHTPGWFTFNCSNCYKSFLLFQSLNAGAIELFSIIATGLGFSWLCRGLSTPFSKWCISHIGFQHLLCKTLEEDEWSSDEPIRVRHWVCLSLGWKHQAIAVLGLCKVCTTRLLCSSLSGWGHTGGQKISIPWEEIPSWLDYLGRAGYCSSPRAIFWSRRSGPQPWATE